MQKLNPMMLLTVLLVTAAFSSCKKEEMKKPGNTSPNTTDAKSLARKGNYIETGILYVGPGGRFVTCLYSGPACMVVCRPIFNVYAPTEFSMTPEEGEDFLQVDLYKSTGMETQYHTRIDVTLDSNGEGTYHFAQ